MLKVINSANQQWSTKEIRCISIGSAYMIRENILHMKVVKHSVLETNYFLIAYRLLDTINVDFLTVTLRGVRHNIMEHLLLLLKFIWNIKYRLFLTFLFVYLQLFYRILIRLPITKQYFYLFCFLPKVINFFVILPP